MRVSPPEGGGTSRPGLLPMVFRQCTRPRRTLRYLSATVDRSDCSNRVTTQPRPGGRVKRQPCRSYGARDQSSAMIDAGVSFGPAWREPVRARPAGLPLSGEGFERQASRDSAGTAPTRGEHTGPTTPLTTRRPNLLGGMHGCIHERIRAVSPSYPDRPYHLKRVGSVAPGGAWRVVTLLSSQTVASPFALAPGGLPSGPALAVLLGGDNQTMRFPVRKHPR